MNLSLDGDVVLDVDILFFGTTRIVSDVPLFENVDYIPFRMRTSYLHLKINRIPVTIKTLSLPNNETPFYMGYIM